jgi:hypothetical protein
VKYCTLEQYIVLFFSTQEEKDWFAEKYENSWFQPTFADLGRWVVVVLFGISH